MTNVRYSRSIPL